VSTKRKELCSEDKIPTPDAVVTAAGTYDHFVPERNGLDLTRISEGVWWLSKWFTPDIEQAVEATGHQRRTVSGPGYLGEVSAVQHGNDIEIGYRADDDRAAVVRRREA